MGRLMMTGRGRDVGCWTDHVYAVVSWVTQPRPGAIEKKRSRCGDGDREHGGIILTQAKNKEIVGLPIKSLLGSLCC